jgi:hypothetical protein
MSGAPPALPPQYVFVKLAAHVGVVRKRRPRLVDLAGTARGGDAAGLRVDRQLAHPRHGDEGAQTWRQIGDVL